MNEARLGLARMQVGLIIVVLVVAVGAGAYALLGQGQGSGGSSQTLNIRITEVDPVNQIDNFDPQNVTAKVGTAVTFAVQNGDDEDRVFTIAALSFNMTIPAHVTGRATLTVDKTGTFMIYSPQTKPSAVSVGKPGSPCTGYLTVTP